MNQEIKRLLKSMTLELPTRDWEEVLPMIEMCLNNSPLYGTSYSPYYLNVGYHPTMVNDVLKWKDREKVEGVSDFVARNRTFMKS